MAIRRRDVPSAEPSPHHGTLRGALTQSNTLRPYLECVRASLTAALTLEDFASQVVERHNIPEIEAQTTPEVVLAPLTISRNEHEVVLIEPAVNSVRLSIKIKQADEIEHILAHKFTRFMMQRAENFVVLRRKPIAGYDISFLITNTHTASMLKHKLVDFVIQFMEEVDKEISEMKLSLNARARIVAESYLGAVRPTANPVLITMDAYASPALARDLAGALHAAHSLQGGHCPGRHRSARTRATGRAPHARPYAARCRASCVCAPPPGEEGRRSAAATPTDHATAAEAGQAPRRGATTPRRAPSWGPCSARGARAAPRQRATYVATPRAHGAARHAAPEQ